MKLLKAYEIASNGITNIRKIILGGDDLTVIMNTNDALSFSRKFLEEFEKTVKIYKDYDLTACAGITYCNEKYPFHYAVKLSEDLCKHAKRFKRLCKRKKELFFSNPSSLMFHNIQSSNVKTFSKFIEDELTINKEEKIRCDFGAYYLNKYDNKPMIEDFEEVIKIFKKITLKRKIKRVVKRFRI